MAIYEIPPGVVGNRFEPAAETALGVVCEIAKLAGKFQQDLLGYVLGVGVLQPPLPAPAVNVTSVVLHELVPSGVVRRIMPKPREQSRIRRREPGVHHGYYPTSGGSI